MFTGVITLEEDAEVVFNNPEVSIFKSRASYRSSEAFATVDKEGQPGKSRRVFMEVSFRVRKFAEEGKEPQLPFDKDELVKGMMLEVSQGDVGIDVVQKDGKKDYYTKLKCGQVYLLGRRPEREPRPPEERAPAKTEKAAPPSPAKSKDQKGRGDEKSYQPRKVRDQADAYPEDAFI